MSNVDIYAILASRTEKFDEVNRYIAFLNNCKRTNKHLSRDFYVEKHHILPKSLFPEYENFSRFGWNSISLTYFQHLIAHSFLSKIFGGKMTFAYSFMLSMIPDIKSRCPVLFDYSMKIKNEFSNRMDRNKYEFQRIGDGFITEPMTRLDFSNRYGIPIGSVNSLFGNSNRRPSAKGWKIKDSKIVDKRRIKREKELSHSLDRNLYRFQNIETNHITEPMTRLDFSKKYGVECKFLYWLFHKNAKNRITKNWRLFKDGDPEIYVKPKDKRSGLNSPHADTNLYRFQNVLTLEITNHITRSEFAETYHVKQRHVNALFGKRKQNKAGGWRLFQQSE